MDRGPGNFTRFTLRQQQRDEGMEIAKHTSKTDNNGVGEVKEFALVTSTTPRTKSLCVLPDLSNGAEKRVLFRASTPLTKHRVVFRGTIELENLQSR